MDAKGKNIFFISLVLYYESIWEHASEPRKTFFQKTVLPRRSSNHDLCTLNHMHCRPQFDTFLFYFFSCAQTVSCQGNVSLTDQSSSSVSTSPRVGARRWKDAWYPLIYKPRLTVRAYFGLLQAFIFRWYSEKHHSVKLWHAEMIDLM